MMHAKYHNLVWPRTAIDPRLPYVDGFGPFRSATLMGTRPRRAVWLAAADRDPIIQNTHRRTIRSRRRWQRY